MFEGTSAAESSVAAAIVRSKEKANLAAWVSIIAGMIGAFMAVLNIQITNASLLDIEGGIGTGLDNGAWISTSYLIGEIVVIPLSGYLSRVFSFRVYMIASTIAFALFSMACAFAHDLGTMIAMRGMQGFAGGALIPMAFTMVVTMLPKRQQPTGLAMFALAVTFAPAIGPTIGGYLTENHGWRSIFFINTGPSMMMVAALWSTLERQPIQLRLLKKGDWAGIAAMAIGLSCLQTLLEEGNKEDWFGSPFIVRLALIATVFLTLFIWIELTVQRPLINLRLLMNRNFGIGTLTNALVGIALFGTVYVLPQYLGQVQGYNAEQIGLVLAWTGLPQLLLIPLVPRLMELIDLRWIGAIGIALFAISCLMNVHMSPDYSGDQLFLPDIVRAVGQALILTPLAAIATLDIAAKDAANASSLFNMLRNLGGAIGTATLATIITKREQFHSNVIGQSVTLSQDAARQRIDQMTGYFMSHGVSDRDVAQHDAIVALGKIVKRQALVLSFSDTFAVLGVVLALAAVTLLFARGGRSVAGAAGQH